MLQDLGSLTEFTYSVSEDQTYLSHEYFHNLITGDFSNRMVDDLINYITNYNYFIGSEIYIQKSDDKKYLPFPSNLKWKVFKDNEDFFRRNLKHGPKLLQDTLKTFLCYDYHLNGTYYWKQERNEISQEGTLTGNPIDLSLTQDASRIKFSIESPYLIDYRNP